MVKRVFKYESSLDSEGRMFNDLKSLLIEHEIPKQTLYNILLAVSEAFTNALVHGNRLNPDKMIELSLAINDGVVIADIIDEGDGDLEALNYRKPPGPMQEGGRGVDLMESFANQIAIRRNDRTGGLQVSMSFGRHGNEKKVENKILNGG